MGGCTGFTINSHAFLLIGAAIPTVFSFIQHSSDKRHRIFIKLLSERINGHAEILREMANLDHDMSYNYSNKPLIDAITEGRHKIIEAVNRNALWSSPYVRIIALDFCNTLSYFLPSDKKSGLTDKEKEELFSDIRNAYNVVTEECRKKSGVYFLEKMIKKYEGVPEKPIDPFSRKAKRLNRKHQRKKRREEKRNRKRDNDY